MSALELEQTGLDRYAKPGDRHFLDALCALVMLQTLVHELATRVRLGSSPRDALETLLQTHLRRKRLTHADRFLLAMLHDHGIDVASWMPPARHR